MGIEIQSDSSLLLFYWQIIYLLFFPFI